MSRKMFPFLLPFRCLTFILIFVIASAVTNKVPDEISNSRLLDYRYAV